MKIAIDKGVSMKTPNQYPFEEMEIGDSFFISCKEVSEENRVRSNSTSATYRLRPRAFKAKKVDGGIRVWRIEDHA